MVQVFFSQPVISQVIAVIAGQHHQGIFPQAFFIQFGQHSADVII